MKVFFIPGAVPSSKNSRVRTKTGLFIASAATQRYKKLSKPYLLAFKYEFIIEREKHPKPTVIGFHFVRGTKHQWDFINALQTIQDEMVHNGLLDDDNTTLLLPVPLYINGSCFSYDKENPGVYFAVLDYEETFAYQKTLSYDIRKA